MRPNALSETGPLDPVLRGRTASIIGAGDTRTRTDSLTIDTTTRTNGPSESDDAVDHELRRLEAGLIARFPTLPADAVRACLDDVLLRWSDATTRIYLPILAERVARAELQQMARSHLGVA